MTVKLEGDKRQLAVEDMIKCAGREASRRTLEKGADAINADAEVAAGVRTRRSYET